MYFDVLIFVSLLVVLIASGIITTRSLSVISNYLKLGHLTAGFIIMAIVTGIPELLVGINSAFAGIPQLSLGDVIGSNIINLSLVIGLAVLISGKLDLENKSLKNETIYLFLIALLPVILLWDYTLSRGDGLILLCAFFIYLFIIYKNKIMEEDGEIISRKIFLKNSLFFIGGVIILIFSSRYLVYYASMIAGEIGIPIFLVGVFIVSFGTSLPELSFETMSLLHGYPLLAIGDLMGSTVANSTLILGVVSIINPIMIYEVKQFNLIAIFFAFFVLMFIIFLRSGRGINRFKALFLIASYVLFLLLTELV